MRTVVVTGVSRGLGLAIAIRTAGDGYKVIGISRDKSEGYQKLMSRLPEQVEFQPLDLCDIDRIADVARETIRRSGPIYGLVNNAGIGLDGVLATMLQTDIDRVLHQSSGSNHPDEAHHALDAVEGRRPYRQCFFDRGLDGIPWLVCVCRHKSGA